MRVSRKARTFAPVFPLKRSPRALREALKEAIFEEIYIRQRVVQEAEGRLVLLVGLRVEEKAVRFDFEKEQVL